MKIRKILTVTPQEKKELQDAIGHISDLICAGKKFCEDMLCTECPFHNKNYVCSIDMLSSNILDDLEEFINDLLIVEED